MNSTLLRPIPPDRLLSYGDVRYFVEGDTMPPSEVDLNRLWEDALYALVTKYVSKSDLSASKVGFGGVTLQQKLTDMDEDVYLAIEKTDRIICDDGIKTTEVDLSSDDEELTLEVDETVLHSIGEQTVSGKKTFNTTFSSLQAPVGTLDASNDGYVTSVFESLLERYVDGSTKVTTGDGLVGGSGLSNNVTLDFDESWLIDQINDHMEANVGTIEAGDGISITGDIRSGTVQISVDFDFISDLADKALADKAIPKT